MRIVHDGKEFKVVFRHGNMLGRRFTRCVITQKLQFPDGEHDGGLAGEGIAYCNPKDQFSKELGRKVSLAKALKETGFAKPIRKEFWGAYLGRKG